MSNTTHSATESHHNDEVNVDKQTLVSLLTTETPRDYFIVYYLFISFIGILLSFGCLLFVPAQYATPICFLLTAMVVFIEIRRRIYSPITLSLLVLYPVLYFLLLTDNPYAAYFGMGIFAWLAILGSFLLLIKKPLTFFYTNELDSYYFHYIISVIWVVSWVICFVSAYLLMPSIWYLVVPFAITVLTYVLIIFLAFFDRWIITKRKTEFTIGDLTFKQLYYPSQAFEDYIDFYARHVSAEVHHKPETFQTLRDAVYNADLNETRDKIAIAAYYKGDIVGSCAISFPLKEELLPLEKNLKMSFGPMRKLGNIGDIGRFVIAPEFRARPDIFRGLLKGVLELALERDVAFLVAEVFPSASLFHHRLGFSTLFERSHPNYIIVFETTGRVIPFFSNLANTFFFKIDKISSATNIDNFVEHLLGVRWVRRQVIRHTFSKPEERPWMHTTESIRYLLGIKHDEEKTAS